MIKTSVIVSHTLLPGTPTNMGESALLAARAIDSYGLDSKQIFLDEGIKLEDINKPNSRIPISIMARVWQQAIKLSRDRYIALTVAKYFNPAAFSVLGTVLLASQNIYNALQQATRYSWIVSDGFTTNLKEDCSELIFSVSPKVGLDSQNYSTAVEVTFCSMYNILRTVVGESFKGKAVHFEHKFLGSKKPFEDFFNCPVYFSCQESKLVFDKNHTLEKQLFSNPALTTVLEKWLENYQDKFNKKSITTRVRYYLFSCSSPVAINLKSICHGLNINPRLMQRKLKEEGTSFRKLLNEHQENQAVKLLTDNKEPISRVGDILGFSDQSNFTRAFRRWTGINPHSFRKSLM